MLDDNERDFVAALGALIDLDESPADDPARATERGFGCFWRDSVLEAIAESVFWAPNLAPKLLSQARREGFVSKAYRSSRIEDGRLVPRSFVFWNASAVASRINELVAA